MMEDHKVIAGESVGELTLKGSRFIWIALPCPHEGDRQKREK